MAIQVTRIAQSRLGAVRLTQAADTLKNMGESRSVSRTVLVELLSGQLAQWQQTTGRANSQVVDLGGGTGGLAVALADYGHDVVVVDPSPNALAALQRRAAEHGLAERIRGVQGDAANLVHLFGADSLDVIACHHVLEIVESPADALAAIAEVLVPGGAFSLLVAQRYAAVMGRVMAGDLDEAQALWQDPSRFDPTRIQQLVCDAGLHIEAVHGIGLVSGPVAEEELTEAAIDTLRHLEHAAGADEALWAAAPSLHIFGTRPTD